MDDPEKVPHQMRVPPRSKKPGAARASLLDSHLNQHQATPDPNTTLTPPHPSRRAQPPTRPPAGAEPYTSPIPTGQQPVKSRSREAVDTNWRKGMPIAGSATRNPLCSGHVSGSEQRQGSETTGGHAVSSVQHVRAPAQAVADRAASGRGRRSQGTRADPIWRLGTGRACFRLLTGIGMIGSRIFRRYFFDYIVLVTFDKNPYKG